MKRCLSSEGMIIFTVIRSKDCAHGVDSSGFHSVF